MANRPSINSKTLPQWVSRREARRDARKTKKFCKQKCFRKVFTPRTVFGKELIQGSRDKLSFVLFLGRSPELGGA